MKKKVPCRVGNILRKGEIACLKQFLLFLQRFPQLYIYSVSKCGSGLMTLCRKVFKHLGKRENTDNHYIPTFVIKSPLRTILTIAPDKMNYSNFKKQNINDCKSNPM